MFKNDYQGGAVVEIFSAQGKDPVAKWKLCGGQTAIRKEFSKEVKGFVYCLDGSSQTIKMQMPKDGKSALGLVQRFLVLQVNVPPSKDFSTELLITDLGHLKRRLYLSTVHKEFTATPLHARIPFAGLKRNIWCNMCIDLVSFTGELFKGAGFLSLDGITVSASCKLRRIFTMKTEPADASDGDWFIRGDGPMDTIPRSCQFLTHVQHKTQVLNMDRVRLADVRTAPFNSEFDQSSSSRSASAQKPRTQDASHIAFGSRVAGPPPTMVRKSSVPSEGPNGKAYCSLNMMPGSGARTSRTGAPERSNNGDLNERPSLSVQKNDYFHELTGKPGSLKPRPPKDRATTERQGSRKLRVHSAGRERPALSGTPDAVLSHPETRSESKETSAPLSSSQRPLPLSEMRGDQTADELLFPSPVEGSWDPSRPLVEPLYCQSTSGLPPSTLQDWGSQGESEEGCDSEPQLSLEEVFTFSSRPHSARRGQGHGEPSEDAADTPDTQGQEDMGGRRGAQPEDDFIASESDEEEALSRFLHQRSGVHSSSATPRSPGPTGDAQHRPGPGSSSADQRPPMKLIPPDTDLMERAWLQADSPSSRRTEPAGMVPTRCLSPNGTRQGPAASGVSREGGQDRSSRISLSWRSVREILPQGDSTLHKVGEERRHAPVGSSSCDLHLLSSLCMHEKEELHMLASLLREQEEEEEEGGATGISASQIHQCKVSISTSSDDTSTWTHIPMPANQGHHYQKEMNPLLHSNPREWMDVLSPPIIPPSQRKWLEGSGDHHKNPSRGADGSVNEEEEEYLNLLYDPCLNCYFDPQTGKYYELA